MPISFLLRQILFVSGAYSHSGLLFFYYVLLDQLLRYTIIFAAEYLTLELLYGLEALFLILEEIILHLLMEVYELVLI